MPRLPVPGAVCQRAAWACGSVRGEVYSVPVKILAGPVGHPTCILPASYLHPTYILLTSLLTRAVNHRRTR